jgi:hypothetical protein
MMAGAFDQHGKPRTVNVLDQVFGISRNKSTFVKEEVTLAGKFNVKVKCFETGINTTSGQALASINYKDKKYPAVIINKFGKGTAIYFACGLPAAYGNWQVMRYFKNNLEKAQNIRNIITRQLADIGIKARVKIENAKGESLKAVYICMKENGPARILGVVRDFTQAKNIDAKTNKWTVKLSNNWHIYDLLERKYIGFGREFSYDFGPVTQSAFSLLPYKVNRLELKTSKSDRQIKIEITVDAETRKYADHIFRVTVLNPDGQSNPAFSKMLFANGGRLTYSFPVPLNAAKGAWTIKVVDALSGEAESVKLTI